MTFTSTHHLGLGRQAARFPVGYRHIDDFVDLSAIPSIDLTQDFDHTHGFDQFRMLGNGPDKTNTVPGHQQGVGDCAYVGTVNVGVVDSVETGETYNWPATNTVVNKELSDDGGQDLGAVLTNLLAQWHQKGLPWSVPILGYGAVNVKSLQDVMAYTNAFGCLYIGISVPTTMDQQAMDGQVLDLTGTDADNQIEGGHCVVVTARHFLASWGMRLRFTDRWLQRYLEEAHVVVTPQQAARKGNGYGLQIDQLDTYLRSLPTESALSTSLRQANGLPHPSQVVPRRN
jgi:hypothetical protein